MEETSNQSANIDKQRMPQKKTGDAWNWPEFLFDHFLVAVLPLASVLETLLKWTGYCNSELRKPCQHCIIHTAKTGPSTTWFTCLWCNLGPKSNSTYIPWHSMVGTFPVDDTSRMGLEKEKLLSSNRCLDWYAFVEFKNLHCYVGKKLMTVINNGKSRILHHAHR